jgi:hypothetical protein
VRPPPLPCTVLDTPFGAAPVILANNAGLN